MASMEVVFWLLPSRVMRDTSDGKDDCVVAIACGAGKTASVFRSSRVWLFMKTSPFLSYTHTHWQGVWKRIAEK